MMENCSEEDRGWYKDMMENCSEKDRGSSKVMVENCSEEELIWSKYTDQTTRKWRRTVRRKNGDRYKFFCYDTVNANWDDT